MSTTPPAVEESMASIGLAAAEDDKPAESPAAAEAEAVTPTSAVDDSKSALAAAEEIKPASLSKTPSIQVVEDPQISADAVEELRSQIRDLQAAMQEQTEKHEIEKQDWKDKLDDKTAQIHSLRVKAHRLEFAMKEAVLFLNKPMSIYDSITKSSQAPRPATMGGGAAGRSRAASVKSIEVLDSKTAGAQPLKSHQVPVTKLIQSNGKQLDVFTNSEFEIQCLECIKLAYNYMNNAMDGIKTARPDAELNLPRLVEENSSGAEGGSEKKVQNIPSQIQLEANSVISKFQIEVTNNSSNITTAQNGGTAPADLIAVDLSSDCKTCAQAGVKLNTQKEMIDSLKQDISALSIALIEERDRRDQLEVAKDVLDKELVDLTEQLFDQANRMVSDEAKIRDQLETSNKELSGQLRHTVKKFEQRDKELKELKTKLRQLQVRSTQSPAFTPSAPLSLSLTSLVQLTKAGQNANAAVGGGALVADGRIAIDGVSLQEFREHIKTIREQGNHIVTHSTPFLKRCLAEDIEPCLFSTFTDYTGKNPKQLINTTFKKRVQESLSHGVYDFELLGTAQKAKCSLCQTSRECAYKTRVSYEENSTFATIAKIVQTEWAPTCQFCKDKMDAVVVFYNYFHDIRKQSASLLGMFRHTLWLRRRMAVARIGSTQLFDGETMGNAAMVKTATPIVVGSAGGYDDSEEWETWVTIKT